MELKNRYGNPPIYVTENGCACVDEINSKGKILDVDRIEYFRDAISRLPKQIPINVILFPMEGDPMAAAEFWNLARITNGAFISPSRDWP